MILLYLMISCILLNKYKHGKETYNYGLSNAHAMVINFYLWNSAQRTGYLNSRGASSRMTLDLKVL